MTDDTSAALERLRKMASLGRIDAETMIAPMDARAILAHIAALEARAEKAETQRDGAIDSLNAWFDKRKIGHKETDQPIKDAAASYLRTCRVGGMPAKISDTAQSVINGMVERGVFASIFAAVLRTEIERAERAEAKVAEAEERGLVFNMLPDGRLDFCAIREGSRLWDGRVRAEAAEAREAELRAVLKGVDDDVRHHLRSDRVDHAVLRKHVVQMVRQALAATPTAPVIPRLNIRCETTNGHVTGSTYLNVVRVEAEDDGSFTAVTDHWPEPQQMEGRNAE